MHTSRPSCAYNRSWALEVSGSTRCARTRLVMADPRTVLRHHPRSIHTRRRCGGLLDGLVCRVAQRVVWMARQVAPVWTDAMDDESRSAWESAVAAADIVVLNELAYERHREQLQDKRLILLTSDASATLSTCEPPTLCVGVRKCTQGA